MRLLGQRFIRIDPGLLTTALQRAVVCGRTGNGPNGFCGDSQHCLGQLGSASCKNRTEVGGSCECPECITAEQKHEQCHDGFCDIINHGTDVCRPLLPIGATCAHNAACASGTCKWLRADGRHLQVTVCASTSTKIAISKTVFDGACNGLTKTDEYGDGHLKLLNQYCASRVCAPAIDTHSFGSLEELPNIIIVIVIDALLMKLVSFPELPKHVL